MNDLEHIFASGSINIDPKYRHFKRKPIDFSRYPDSIVYRMYNCNRYYYALSLKNQDLLIDEICTRSEDAIYEQYYN